MDVILISISVIVVFSFISAAALLIRYYRIHLYARYTGFPKPRYRVISERNVMVAMQDGTQLATDVYRPDSRWKFPVIIMRTPYGKDGSVHPYRQMAEVFASLGYVFLVQDVRGKGRSEGKFYPYAYEALDGHTTITWAGESPWSNGKVALVGFSYLGSCAWLASRYRSHYLRTIIPMFTTQNTYSMWVDKGVPFLKGPLMWLSKHSGKLDNEKVTHKSVQPALWHLPVNELDTLTVHQKLPFYREFLAHTSPDAFWEEMGGHHAVDSLDIPALLIGGWYDTFLNGTIDDYQRLVQASATSKNHHSRLLLGPWCHNPGQKVEELNFGKEAGFNTILLSILHWCDVWLKEGKVVANQASKVRYFIMGRNEWKESDRWPPSDVTAQKLYLSLDEGSWRGKKGTLTPSPGLEAQESHYTYNPRDPVLFKGGQMLDSELWIAPIEQGEIVARDDVLIFTTPPFEEELVIAGAVKVILHVSSEAFDTDFCAKICDRHPNGRTYNLASGFLRMRFRDSITCPKMMEPGVIYRVEITLRSVAIAFLKDHRLQLQITSSDFPTHNRNLNTGMSCEFSTEIKEVEQTVYTGGAYDSHILLPVLHKEAV